MSTTQTTIVIKLILVEQVDLTIFQVKTYFEWFFKRLFWKLTQLNLDDKVSQIRIWPSLNKI